ncbi:MAG: aldehyde dehydrogenase family protein [Gemmatimonadetes bacterium]|nr:aldehyde dehydrogenase family protein [Gemmatimonadota bacterium]
MESRDPATGEVWKSYAAATPDEVAAAIARARAALPAWAAAPLGTRVRLLRRFHEVLYRRRHDVAAVLTRENGKSAAEAFSTEIATTLDFARYYAARAPRFLRPSWRMGLSLAMKRKRVRILHEPYGVIAIVAPWNYPFMLAAAEALPALATGNVVLMKPSEFTPSTGALLGELFAEAGAPAGVVTVLQGDGAVGAALTRGDVDKVFFTGSVATGRKVALACAERLIPCSLELGGSDAAIVLADANVAHAARGVAWGRFSNAGQTCVAPKRVFVEAPVYDAFVAELGKVVGALRVGPGSSPDTDVTAVIRPSSVATLTAQRDDALARGARVVATAAAPTTGGSYFAPTVLADVPADARVLVEETFGPLLPVVKVRDADDAVARANASDFGLSGSIWSGDTSRAAALAARIETGSVTINDAIVAPGMVEVPHGGVKTSGVGRSHGMEGLAECVRTKAVVADQFSAWRQAWWYGYSASHAAGLDAYVRLAHSPSVVERVLAIPAFLRILFAPKRPL